MKAQVIKIGNSRGLLLSKTILSKYNIQEDVEIVLEKNRIVIMPVEVPRKDWEKSFKKMHKEGDDQLLIDDVFADEYPEEWS